VTEILTPGSITGDPFLEPAANNFLAALWPSEQRLGVCLADASTGEVKLAEPAWDEASSMLSRLRVAEWVTPLAADLGSGAERLEAALRGLPGARSPVPASRFHEPRLLAERWSPESLARVEDLPAAR